MSHADPIEQGEMLWNRIKKNQKRLKSWLSREKLSCYRLYDRDIPEIPLAVDWYEGRLHVAEYARKGRSEERPDDWVRTALQATRKGLGVPEELCYFKTRDRKRGATQYRAQGTAFNREVVSEGGHKFLVNLVDYLDTGLFLDHRRTRALVAAESKDKMVLNLFCYTGSFNVYAGAAGAASTMGIDLSATYLEWARDNLDLNELERERHRLRRGDVQEELAELAAEGRKFDLVVVDPPTFSNSKRMKEHFDVLRDQVPLLKAVRKVLTDDGVVYFSTNHRKFKLDEEGLEGAFSITEISDRTLPNDFRDKKIHRCWRMEAK